MWQPLNPPATYFLGPVQPRILTAGNLSQNRVVVLHPLLTSITAATHMLPSDKPDKQGRLACLDRLFCLCTRQNVTAYTVGTKEKQEMTLNKEE